MHKGIRAGLIATGLIVLAYPAGAWLIGVIVEGQIERREQQALERAPYLVLVRRDYRRGVYASTEELTYALRGPLASALGVAPVANKPRTWQVQVRNTIHHGPLPQLRTVALATIDTEVPLPPELQTTLGPSLGGQPLVSGRARMGWSGSSCAVLTSPPFEAQLPQGSTLRWRGLQMSVSSTRDQRAWSLDASAPGLTLGNGKFRIRSDDLRVHAVMRRLFTELDVGTSGASLAQLDFEAIGAGGAVSMQRISLESASSMEGDYVDSKVALTIAKLHGGAFTASDLGYTVALNHLHAQALAALTREVRAAARDLYAGSDTGSVTGTRTRWTAGAGISSASFSPVAMGGIINPAQQKMLDVFRRDGMELLLHEPILEIPHLGFQTADGQFSLSLKLSAPGLTREDLKGPAPLASLIPHLNAVADLRVDTALLDSLFQDTARHDQMTSQLNALEAQGFLKRDGAALAAHILLSGGHVSVNGQPYPPRR